MLPRSHGCKAIQSGQVRRLTVSCAKLMRDMFQNNILFGAPYNEGRYRQGLNNHNSITIASCNLLLSAVIYQCGLGRDLDLFEAGDMTEVGEKGLTLR